MELDDCLENISKGDIQSLECLYNKLKTPVYAFALSMVRSKAAAEDILQDTFIKVYEKASLVEHEKKYVEAAQEFRIIIEYLKQNNFNPKWCEDELERINKLM